MKSQDLILQLTKERNEIRKMYNELLAKFTELKSNDDVLCVQYEKLTKENEELKKQLSINLVLNKPLEEELPDTQKPKKNILTKGKNIKQVSPKETRYPEPNERRED